VTRTISTVYCVRQVQTHKVVMDIIGEDVVSYGTVRYFNNASHRFYGLQNKIKYYFSPLTFKRIVSLDMGLKMGCMAHRITDCSKCECIQASTCSYYVHKIMRQRFRKAHMDSIDNKDYSSGVMVYLFDC